jgi:hypothetical protein
MMAVLATATTDYSDDSHIDEADYDLARFITISEAILGAGPYLWAAHGPQSKGVGQWQVAIKARHARRIRGKKVLWGSLR